MKGKTIAKFLLALSLAGSLFAPVSQSVGKVNLGATVVYADSDDSSDSDSDDNNASLYAKASELANAFNQGLAALSDSSASSSEKSKASDVLTFSMKNTSKGAVAGNAGGALGYADDPTGKLDLGRVVNNWITSKVSANSYAYSYKTLKNVTYFLDDSDEGKSSNPTKAFIAYAYYGKALTDLGYMKMLNPTFSAATNSIGRTIGGGLILILYILALIIPIMFSLVVKLLMVFNPYAWLSTGLSSVSDYAANHVSVMQRYMGSNTGSSVFAKAMSSFSDVYSSLANLGLVAIVIMLGWTVFTIFAFQRTKNTKSRLTAIVVRFLVSVLAVPLVGGTYTSALQWLNKQNMASNGTSYVNYVMASTFIRTDDWIENTRLAAPSNNGDVATTASNTLISINSDTGKVDDSRTDARRAALAINAMSNTDSSNWAKSVFDNVYGGSSNTDKLGSNFDSNSVSDDNTSVTTDENSWKVDFSNLVGADSVKWNFDTVLSYMGTNLYSASTYDSFVKGTVHSKSGNEAMSALTSLTMNDVANATYLFASDAVSANRFSDEAKDTDFYKDGVSKRPLNIYNNGWLTYLSSGNSFNYVDSNGSTSQQNGTYQTSHIATEGDASKTYGFGLSDLAMYNFLNTNFRSSDIVVYSPENSTSNMSIGQYQSIVIPGRGADMFLLWLETVVILAVFILIGVVFWWEMVRNVFSTLFGVLFNAFGSVVGSLNMAAKMVLYTFLGAGQLVIAMVFYQVVMDVMVSMISAASSIASGNFSVSAITLPLGSIGFGNVELSTSVLSVFTRILIILVLVVTSMLVIQSYRKRIVDVFTELVTNWITKLTSRLDVARGGDGQDVSQRLRTAADNNKKLRENGGQLGQDYNDILKNKMEMDRLDKDMGRPGKSKGELKKEAMAEALKMQGDRTSDAMRLGRMKAEDDPTSRVSQSLAERKMALDDKKQEHSEFKRRQRENVYDQTSNAMRNDSINSALASQDFNGFGDVDAQGRVRDDARNLSYEERDKLDDINSAESLRSQAQATQADLAGADETIAAKKAKLDEVASRYNAKQVKLDEAKSVKTTADKNLEDINAKVTKAESRVANAIKRVDEAQTAVDLAVASNDANAMADAQAELSEANGELKRERDEYGSLIVQQNAAQEAVSLANKGVDAAENTGLDDEYKDALNKYNSAVDTISSAKRDQRVQRLAAKKILRNNQAVMPTRAARSFDANGNVQKAFAGDVDQANSQLTQLHRGMIEAEAVQSAAVQARAQGDDVTANRLDAEAISRNERNESIRRDLVSQGFSSADLTSAQKVSETANAFNEDFEAFAKGQNVDVNASLRSQRNAGKQRNQQLQRRRTVAGQSNVDTQLTDVVVNEDVDVTGSGVQGSQEVVVSGHTHVNDLGFKTGANYNKVSYRDSGTDYQGSGVDALSTAPKLDNVGVSTVNVSKRSDRSNGNTRTIVWSDGSPTQQINPDNSQVQNGVHRNRSNSVNNKRTIQSSNTQKTVTNNIDVDNDTQVQGGTHTVVENTEINVHDHVNYEQGTNNVQRDFHENRQSQTNGSTTRVTSGQTGNVQGSYGFEEIPVQKANYIKQQGTYTRQQQKRNLTRNGQTEYVTNQKDIDNVTNISDSRTVATDNNNKTVKKAIKASRPGRGNGKSASKALKPKSNRRGLNSK